MVFRREYIVQSCVCGCYLDGVAVQRSAQSNVLSPCFKVITCTFLQKIAELLCETIGADRDAASERLAENKNVRLKLPGPRQAAIGTDVGVGLVDDEQGRLPTFGRLPMRKLLRFVR